MFTDIGHKFHIENDIIITSKEKISHKEVFNCLADNLKDFRENTQFIVMCGMHGSEDGKLDRADMNLVDDYHTMIEHFHDEEKNPELIKIIKERKYEMGTVLELRSKEEHYEDKTKFVMRRGSKSAIKMLFNSLLTNQLPIVLILASCWSFQSELFNIIRASGLLSALNISEERGKITIGNMLQLDKFQQEVLRTIIKDETIKDVFFQGMDFKIICYTKLVKDRFVTEVHILMYILFTIL